MKLLLQKVRSAAVQVNGLVVNRIGVGLVLYIGFRDGDTGDELKTLAAKVAKVQLWPDVSLVGSDGDSNADPPRPSNIVDCGYEVLVVLQQSLHATFPGPQPSQREAMDETEAQLLFQEFLKQLRVRYQEEMVVAAPFGEGVRVETSSDGTGLFDLSVLNEPRGPARAGKAAGRPPAPGKTAQAGGISVETVSKALRKLGQVHRSKLEKTSSQIYMAMGTKKFRDTLAEATQDVATDFAEALDSASHYFSERQQEQITAWTGLAVSSAAEEVELDEAEDAPEAHDEATPADDLDHQLAELREEVGNPELAAARKVAASKAAVRPPASRVKTEEAPDVSQFETPAMAAARSWVSSRQQHQHWQKTHRPREPTFPPKTKGGKGKNGKGKNGKGKKGKGWGRRSIGGILSLDEAASLHGTTGLQDFESGQLKRFADTSDRRPGLLRPKVETTEASGYLRRKPAGPVPQPPRKLAKGIPTLAVMTPPPNADDFSDI